MFEVEELLQPIEEGAPAGPDLSDSNEFAEIELLHSEAYRPDTTENPFEDASDLEEDWDSKVEQYAPVVEPAIEFIRASSKDLKVAALLTNSALRTDGFAGLASGLELCLRLMEEFWDTLHPSKIDRRANVLDWLSDDATLEDPAVALYGVPLTEMGHDYFAYREWKKSQAAEEKGGESEGQGAFGPSFATTDRQWYVDLVASLHRCASTIEKLDAFSKERFPPEVKHPPNFKRKLGGAIASVTSAAEELLALKPAPPAPIVEEAAPTEGQEATPGAPAVTMSITEPRSTPEAHQAAAAAARYLRKQDPFSPASYLILRGLRWGELRGGGEPIDPMALDAPETSVRKRLKTLFLNADWPDLLEAAEQVMATAAGRGWLDLQHYAIVSAEALGPEYSAVVDALKSALRSLLEDRSALLSATLMDDSYAVSPRTLEWLQSQGLTPEGIEDRRPAVRVPSSSRGHGGDARANARRAAGMASRGNPERAVEMLLDQAQREVSQRSRTITKAEAAAIMLDHGMATAAVPTLEELLQLIDQHGLEAWEEPDVVARWIGLLYRCREAVDGQKDAQLMQRIAKLDPLEAVAVERGPPAAAEPEAPDEASDG